MSKTRSRIYSNGYRAGRKATRWERFKWLVFHHRVKVEDWMMDEDSRDVDFLVVLFAAVALALAGVVMMFLARA